MQPSAEQITQAFTDDAVDRLQRYAGLIRHCVEQLSDEQLWWRAQPAMNSIANLMLHLIGNMRQFVCAGLAGQPDTRDRKSEFLDRSGLTRTELLERFDAMLAEVVPLLNQVPPHELLVARTIMNNERTGLNAIFQCIAHFAMHAQEIVVLTRLQLGEAYQFQGMPPYPVTGP